VKSYNRGVTLTIQLLLLPKTHILSSAGLLLTSQLHNASQLSAWCLHFISSNYVVFKDKEEFSQLVGDNMDYISQHRWPPLSYEQAMEEYRKKYLEEESDESAEDSEKDESEGEGGSEEGAGSGAEGGEEKSFGGVEKRKLWTGRKGSVVGGRRRTRNKAAAAVVTGGRGRTNNRCRVM
jgi:hypothetical protein